MRELTQKSERVIVQGVRTEKTQENIHFFYHRPHVYSSTIHGGSCVLNATLVRIFVTVVEIVRGNSSLYFSKQYVTHHRPVLSSFRQPTIMFQNSLLFFGPAKTFLTLQVPQQWSSFSAVANGSYENVAALNNAGGRRHHRHLLLGDWC